MSRQGDEPTSSIIDIPNEELKFSGQARLETWSLKDQAYLTGCVVYSNQLVRELDPMMYHIRDLALTLPFYQGMKNNGHPSMSERNMLICYLVQQIFKATNRQTQGLLNHLADQFGIRSIPDKSVQCKYYLSQIGR